MGKVYKLLFFISWGLGELPFSGCNIAYDLSHLYTCRGSERDTLMRSVVLRLLLDEEAEARLRALYSFSSKLWNEISMLSRYDFKSSKRLRRMFKRSRGGRSDIISTGL
jgi:hypothetical protein